MTNAQRSKIATQVREIVEQSLANEQYLSVSMVSTAVVSSWAPPSGADADMWTICGYQAVKKIAQDVIRRTNLQTDEDGQVVFEGYEGVRRVYAVQGGLRDGLIVPAEKLTLSEGNSILGELDRVIDGATTHRDNFSRFIDEVLATAGNGN